MATPKYDGAGQPTTDTASGGVLAWLGSLFGGGQAPTYAQAPASLTTSGSSAAWSATTPTSAESWFPDVTDAVVIEAWAIDPTDPVPRKIAIVVPRRGQ